MTGISILLIETKPGSLEPMGTCLPVSFAKAAKMTRLRVQDLVATFPL
jgi:hypothetical protein